MREVFRPIKGYEGLYEVSNLGNVKSLGNGKSRNPNLCRERILKSVKNNKGYLYINLCRNGNAKIGKIARLVAIAFIPNPENLPELNHKNSLKHDNRVQNLEWCNQRYNRNHYHQTQNTSSKYPGVSWNKRCQKWHALLNINCRSKHLGYFTDEKKAVEAYRNAVKELEVA